MNLNWVHEQCKDSFLSIRVGVYLMVVVCQSPIVLYMYNYMFIICIIICSCMACCME